MRRATPRSNAAATLTAALVLISCEQKPTERERAEAEVESATEALDGVFIDLRHGYRIAFPSSWALADHTRGNRMIRADISEGKTAGVQIRVVGTGEESFVEFADRYARSFRDDMLSHWGGTMEELDRGSRSLGANRGFCVSFHARRGQGGQWLLLNCLVPSGNNTIVFQCGAPFEDRRSYEELFEAIVPSLELDRHG
jgi:hypothetical protein